MDKNNFKFTSIGYNALVTGNGASAIAIGKNSKKVNHMPSLIYFNKINEFDNFIKMNISQDFVKRFYGYSNYDIECFLDTQFNEILLFFIPSWYVRFFSIMCIIALSPSWIWSQSFREEMINDIKGLYYPKKYLNDTAKRWISSDMDNFKVFIKEAKLDEYLI